jgi:nitrite reductase/ring-hydroxylating ferredoxin subunit
VGDGHVLVARLGSGEVVAFSPVCPHQFTELDEASIRDGVLRCPRHGYLYDTRTGENVHPGREARPDNLWKLRPGYLPTFDVVEEDGWISVIDIARRPPDCYDRSAEEPPLLSGDHDPVPASSSAQPVPPAPSSEPFKQSVKFLTMTSGSTTDIRLPIVPRPGFAWHFEVMGPCLRVVADQDEPAYSPCHLVQVAADGVGVATLTCRYATDESEAADVWTFIVRVQPG